MGESLYDMRPVHEGSSTPSEEVLQQFGKVCAKSPNAEVAAAAASCSAPALHFLSQSPSRKELALASGDNALDGSEAYSDCNIEVDSPSVHLAKGKNLTG